MDWQGVGDWLKNNAGTGAALVGELLTGQVPAAIATGVSLVASATGSKDPTTALATLQADPTTVVKLRELALQSDMSIRAHIETMTKLELDDAAAEHTQTQETIRSGDNSQDPFVRRTRPAQSWVSLTAGIVYVLAKDSPDMQIAMLLFTLPLAYAGLRQLGKGIDAVSGAWQARKQA